MGYSVCHPHCVTKSSIFFCVVNRVLRLETRASGSLVRTGSLDRELARRMGRGKVSSLFLALPTLFLALPVLGTSEPARRLWRCGT